MSLDCVASVACFPSDVKLVLPIESLIWDIVCLYPAFVFFVTFSASSSVTCLTLFFLIKALDILSLNIARPM